MEARVTFTDEFKRKTKSTPTKRELGELRYARLRKLDESGELSKCRTRQDVADVLGIKGKTGKSFVARTIYSGKLEEIVRGKEWQTPICEYHWAYKDESYKKHDVPVQPITSPAILSGAYASALNEPEVYIEYGELRITIKQCSADYLATIIKNVK